MLGLIMAGGLGKRLSLGEKPLILLSGNPLIAYVVSACIRYGIEPIVITTSSVPYTRNWCRSRHIDEICSPGSGYIPDLHWAVRELNEKKPFFSLVCDNPFIKPSHLQTLMSSYEQASTDAGSLWVPVRLFLEQSRIPPYREYYGDQLICPTGHNILTGEYMNNEQEEVRCIVEDPFLTYAINTRDDLNFLRSHEGDPRFQREEVLIWFFHFFTW